MSATGISLAIFTFVALFVGSFALYEDQIGKFDWRQQYIGKVTHMFWEQISGTSGGKKLYVGTEKNVIASINSATGAIYWRKVFEDTRRGDVDDLLYNGDLLVSMLGGRRVTAWNPASGNLGWEVFLPGEESHRGVLAVAGENNKVIYLAMTSQGVFGINRDGRQKWDVELPNSDTVNYKKLLVHDGTVYIVGMTSGSEVKVMTVDLDGSVMSTKSVLAGFLRKDTNCEVVQEKFLLCYCPSSESFQVLNLRAPQGFVATSIQDLGVGQESIQLDNWRADFSTNARGMVIRLATGHSVFIEVGNTGRVTVKKNLPKAVSAASVLYEDRLYLLNLEQSGHEELSLTGYDIATGEEVSDLVYKVQYPAYNGLPAQISGLLAKRNKDGRLMFKLAIVSDDLSLQLIHKTGKLAWRREESLAYLTAVEMVDLPVTENQAKFEDEFGSHEDNILTMFVKRIKTQLSQLQTFILQQLHRLQGVKHHSSVVDTIEDEEEEEDLLRDEFSLHKMIIIVTAPGKVIAMKSINGHIIWQQFIPELAPFEQFGELKVMLHTQRTTAHFPHPPQCIILGKNKRTGRGHLYAFNPITGHRVDQMPAGGIHLPYNVLQAFLLGEMDDHFLKGLLIFDEFNVLHTYPPSLLSFVKAHKSSLFLYVADTQRGIISGYRMAENQDQVIADKVWNINIQSPRQNLKITNIAARSPHEHVHSQGRVLGDRSVLYKYLNPNLVVIIAEGEDTTQQKANPFINVYLVDVVTGHILFHGNHKKAHGPVNVIHSENWVVYNYFSTRHRRYEMGAIEMYEGKEQSNATAFSSFTAPAIPLVMRQSFIFPMPMYTMATTITEKGITNKDILVALKTGGVFSLPKAFLDPRRPLQPTQETAEEGTLPYIPELPVATEAIINYNQSVFHVRGIHTAPTGLESTSLVLVHGLDLFFTRVQPSKMFDVLKEDFEHWLIAGVVSLMLFASFITQKLASGRALSKQWK